MFESYRRDQISKSLFRFSEIVFGASVVSVWFAPFPIMNKLVLGLSVMLIFVVAIVFCRPTPPGREE